ncbi:MAG: hypothetical protein KAG61_04200 [Bacteriovoracaceae bacterium]|nr:hypothetical protein [Bacteriovoracaceae bacterium]
MEKNALADLIDREQFKNLKHKFVFYNLTTETELLIPELVKLVTFGSGTISLQIPKKSCSEGHLLEVYIIPEIDTQKNYNKAILAQLPGVAILKGKVAEVIPSQEKSKFMDIVVALESFDDASYKAVIEKYEKRQCVLDSILQRCKA